VEAGQTLTFDDVELPDSLAARAWCAIRDRALPAPAGVSFGRNGDRLETKLFGANSGSPNSVSI
jgi:hypothetical protein